MSCMDKTNESSASILCKSCGLCCTGHLFIWVRLKATELDRSQVLGLNVIRSDPRQRGFTQPCPLWQGQCTIYTSPDYPRVCRTYKCKMLKDMLEEKTALPDAMNVIREAMGMIRELESHLSVSPGDNFRERLVAVIEGTAENTNPGLSRKAKAMVKYYEEVFGVKDLFDKPRDP